MAFSARSWWIAGAAFALVAALAVAVQVQPADGLTTCGGKAATIGGTDGDDDIEGTDGDDVIIAGAGDDEIDGHDGDDVICGGNGDDEIDGGDDEDRIYGGSGTDTVTYEHRDHSVTVTLAGNDDDDGESGEHDNVRSDVEKVVGGDAGDVLIGDSDRNWLYGGDGNDLLKGRGDRDRLFGESGNDTLRGGPDVDRCDGGFGVDVASPTCEHKPNVP
jgi:Ca2+-binding RTX toxin-like protein